MRAVRSPSQRKAARKMAVVLYRATEAERARLEARGFARQQRRTLRLIRRFREAM